MSVASRPPEADPIRIALASHRSALVGAAIFSAIINILLLTGPIFMLQVYDRVVTSRSEQTLVALFGIAVLLLILLAILDQIRAGILVRIGAKLDQSLREYAFNAVIEGQLLRSVIGDGQQPVRDLDVIRNFMSGPGFVAILDLPWMPLYLIVCFLFHPLLGSLALVGSLILIVLTVWGYLAGRTSTRVAAELTAKRNAWMENGRRSAETLRALGMMSEVRGRWTQQHAAGLAEQMNGADIAARISSVTKAYRILLQAILLSAGAYLVIERLATPGVMLAASIISARALQPIEQIIAQWRPFLQYRDAKKRLGSLVVPPERKRTSLRPPSRELVLADVAVAPPRAREVLLKRANFKLTAGQGVAVIGPSGAGKSTLARGLVGVWTIVHGELRFDDATPDQWGPEEFGKLIGYLPQSGELFDGTIAENIARFDRDTDDAKVLAAADAAGATSMILKLPRGFDTVIGEANLMLSAGQRQRIGLARALYREPFLVVLDEPNSNLDAEGEAALAKAIRGVRDRAGIVIVMAHRPSALAEVDQVLFIRDGQQVMFGPRDEVLKRVVANPEIAGRSGGISARAVS